MQYERLHKTKHNIESFCCGEDSMDDFLRECGASEAYGNTYIVLRDQIPNEIIAYFTLMPDPLDWETEIEAEVDVVFVSLERLAVDQKYQRQGVGKRILAFIIKEILASHPHSGVEALALVPLDAAAETYYLHLGLGFRKLTPNVSSKLVLFIEEMKASSL